MRRNSHTSRKIVAQLRFNAFRLQVFAAMVLCFSSSPGADQDRTKASVRSAMRGARRINLEEGIRLSAPLGKALRAAEPLGLAAGDFDEDGMPDLVVAYRVGRAGLIVLHRGNVDALFPNTPEARRHGQNSPFLPDPKVFETATVPEFLGVGDFDADGHSDLVLGERGGRAITYLPGDGRGQFGAAQQVLLPGALTTLLTGDVNRTDGLTDVVAAVAGGEEPGLLVFEDPRGARHAKPELFSLPEEASALAIGNLDDDLQADIAVAAGRQLLIVHGRDRRLSLDPALQQALPPAMTTGGPVAFGIRSLAIGNFSGDGAPELAVLSDAGVVHILDLPGQTRKESARAVAHVALPERRSIAMPMASPSAAPAGMPLLATAKVSGLPGEDVLVLDPTGRHIHIIPGNASEQGYELEDLDVEGEVAAVLPIRLRANAISDMVVLTSAAASPIVMFAPGANFVVTNTADSGPGSLRQALSDADANPGLDTISFNIPGTGPYTITVGGVRLTANDPVTIDATTQPGYAGTPIVEVVGRIHLLGGSSTLRGLSIHSPAVDSFGTYGEAVILGREFGSTIQPVNGGNVVENCYIGLRPDGVTEGPTIRQGILITSPNNRIGGTVPAARNVISGNRREGIAIAVSSPTAPNGNIVQGNYIGTTADGTAALGNFTDGVYISGGSGNTIGGAVAGAGNLISGNGGAGVHIDARSNTGLPQNNNLVQGNFIGTNAAGMAAIPNGLDGVILRPGDFPSLEIANNLIGGTTPAAGNLISGNNQGGVWIGYGNPHDNLVQGNLIGTAIDGASALGNGYAPPPGATHNDGICLDGPGGDGVTSGPSNHTIGGTAPGSGNVIGFNAGSGVNVTEAFNTLVAGNTIFSNIHAGIAHFSRSNRTRVSGNSIFSNGGLGIDHIGVGPSEGVTANDACDADAFFVNPLQNFPILTSAASNGSSTLITGSLNSAANTTFTLEFFSSPAGDPSGYGEGQTYLGSATVTTGANCVADFSGGIKVPTAVADGQYVTATAIDPDGNTSEFSAWQKATATANQPPVAVTDNYSVNEDQALNVSAPGVLGNDTDPDPGTTLTAIQVTPPTHGTLTLNANGSFSYTPGANYSGADSFSYKANDGLADSSATTVFITVNPINDPPVAADDAYTVTQNTPLTVPAAGVLANDTDADVGAALTAIQVAPPSNGTLTLNADGSFTYTPNAGFSGTDTFTYKANDGIADSNVVTVTLTVSSTADLAVSITAPEPVAHGEQLTYTITVINSGSGTATTVSLFLELPPSFTFLSGSGVGVQSCRPPVFASNLAVCRLSDVPPGGEVVAALTVQPGPIGQYLLNTNINSITPDPNPANNQQFWLTTVAPAADLTVQIGGAAGSLPGDVVFTVTVSNTGPDTATGITLRGFMGGVASFDTSVANGGNCIQSGVLPMVCDLYGATILPNASVIFQLRGKATAPGDATLQLTGTVAEIDPVPGNNAAQAQVTVSLPTADISLFSGWAMGGVTLNLPLEEGDVLEWIFRVSNSGPQTATGVSVALEFPPADQVSSGVPPGCLFIAAGRIVCSFPDIPSQSQTLFLQINLKLVGTGTHTFTANALAGEYDPDPVGNKKSASIPVVVRQADVSIFSGFAVGGVTLNLPLEEGDEMSWALRVYNNGPRAATGVIVALDFPASDSVVGGVPSGCLLTSPGKMTCGFPDVAAQSQSFFMEINLKLTGTGSQSFTARVLINEVDPNPADNTKTNNIPVVVRQADISLFSGFAVNGVTLNLPLAEGDLMSWLLRVSNSGPRDATAVSVGLEFPRTDLIVGGVPPGCLLIAPGQMTCSFPDVAAQSQSLFMEIQLRLAGAGTHVFTATALAREVDPNPADNTKTANIPVIGPTPLPADVAITAINGTLSGPTHLVGESGTLAINVTNLGPAAATGVSLTAYLSPQLRIDSVSTPCVITGQTVNCALGSMAAGATATPVLAVTAVVVGNASLNAAVGAAENIPGGNDNAGLTFSIYSTAATPFGPNGTTQLGAVAVSFANVSTPGVTTVSGIAPPDPILPPGLTIFNNLAFDVSTTAAIGGPIGIAFDVSGLTPTDPMTPQVLSTLRVLHGEAAVPGGPVAFVDRTAPTGPTITPSGQVVMPVFAGVSSLSPFIIARLSDRIVFSSNREGDFEIYSMNSDGSDARRLTDNPGADLFPAWSLDHSKIAFTSTRDGNAEIYTMNADGSSPVRLTVNSHVDGGPAWSPDGTRIAFTSARDGNLEIYSMNADGSALMRLTRSAGADTSPTWSPDGRRIAFTSTRNGNFEIYSMNADGTGVKRLTSSLAVEASPAWSPDGSRIAFSSNRGGLLNFDIWVMNAEGSSPGRLTTNAGVDGAPAWSRDGSRIAFTSNRYSLLNLDILTMNSDGTGQTRLTTGQSVDSSPHW